MTGPADDELLAQYPREREDFSRQFLDLFYPVHYRIGIGIEDAMRRGKLTRHQVAVMWLMRTEGSADGELRRKDVERRLTDWFEIQNSAVSKTLRSLSRGPDPLIDIVEDPDSAREKRVRLTDAGREEIDALIDAGTRFIERMVDHLTANDSEEGVRFLSKVSDIIEIVRDESDESGTADA